MDAGASTKPACLPRTALPGTKHCGASTLTRASVVPSTKTARDGHANPKRGPAPVEKRARSAPPLVTVVSQGNRTQTPVHGANSHPLPPCRHNTHARWQHNNNPCTVDMHRRRPKSPCTRAVLKTASTAARLQNSPLSTLVCSKTAFGSRVSFAVCPGT